MPVKTKTKWCIKPFNMYNIYKIWYIYQYCLCPENILTHPKAGCQLNDDDGVAGEGSSKPKLGKESMQFNYNFLDGWWRLQPSPHPSSHKKPLWETKDIRRHYESLFAVNAIDVSFWNICFISLILKFEVSLAVRRNCVGRKEREGRLLSPTLQC